MASGDWVMVSPTFSKRSSHQLSRKNTVKAPAEPTPTFNLPSEIRIKIYKYALKSPEPFNLLENKNGLRLAHIYQPTFPWTRFHLAKQLLLVSRKTYEEAVEVLYGENTFQFAYDMKTIQQLLEKLLPSTRSCIKRIDFQGAGSFCFQSIGFEAQLAQLGTIRQTLATHNPGFQLQCIGFDAPLSSEREEKNDGGHRKRLTQALIKLFQLKIATTVKFSGHHGIGWQRWDDTAFALMVERCLDEEKIGAQISLVAEDDTFSRKRSSVVVTFV